MNGVSYAYTYDERGNIHTATEGGVSHTYTYGDSVWKDLLTAYDGQAITYDAIGNPLSYRGMTMSCFIGRELETVVKNVVTADHANGGEGVTFYSVTAACRPRAAQIDRNTSTKPVYLRLHPKAKKRNNNPPA